jgi:hypothetical protein
VNKFTVYFDEPFWVGVLEQIEGGKLETAKVVFGKEPKDREIYEWVLSEYYKLGFSPPVDAKYKDITQINPKRLQRKIRDATRPDGIGTKAQQAIKLAQEANKTERKQLSKEQREAAKARLFELHSEKKKQKKKGH